MTRRAWWAIGLLVAVAHLAVLWLVAGERVLPKRPYVPPPNFGYAEGEMVDETTGERVRVRQFTVSTKLAGETGMADATNPQGGSPEVEPDALAKESGGERR